MADYDILLRDHVTLTCRSIDRLFIQGYVPQLQSVGQVCRFLVGRGCRIPSSAAFGQIGERYVAELHRWTGAARWTSSTTSTCTCGDPEWGPATNAYAPYPVWLWLNGHVWAKRQLTMAGIGYRALDDGFRSCADPSALQRICDGLGPAARARRQDVFDDVPEADRLPAVVQRCSWISRMPMRNVTRDWPTNWSGRAGSSGW